MNNTNKNPPSFESGFCLAPPAGLVQAKRLIIVLSNDVALSTSETSRRLAQAMTHDIRRGPERTSDNLHTAYAVSCVIRRVRPTNSKFTVRCTSLHRRIVVAYRLSKSTALSTPCFGRFRCVKTTLSCFLLATTSLRPVGRAHYYYQATADSSLSKRSQQKTGLSTCPFVQLPQQF